jgi:hypothetical protein
MQRAAGRSKTYLRSGWKDYRALHCILYDEKVATAVQACALYGVTETHSQSCVQASIYGRCYDHFHSVLFDLTNNTLSAPHPAGARGAVAYQVLRKKRLTRHQRDQGRACRGPPKHEMHGPLLPWPREPNGPCGQGKSCPPQAKLSSVRSNRLRAHRTRSPQVQHNITN